MKTNIRLFLSFFAIVFLIQTIPAGPARASSAEDKNVVIILDSSGSMAELMSDSRTMKMDAAKKALKEVIKEVPQDTKIGLLVFSSKNSEEDWFYPLGKRDDAALFKAIDAPVPGWKTPLGQYIKIGADRLLQERDKQHGYGTFNLLIVTDGEATDHDFMEKYVPEVLARGVTIDVIGVNMEQDHTLATKVNSFRMADDPEMLKKAIVQVFAEVSGTGTDTTDEDAFEQLAGIPYEIAAAMLKTLSNTGNQPIGEAPTGSLSDEQQGSAGGNTPFLDFIGDAQETLIAFFVFALILLILIVNSVRKKRLL